MRRQADAGEHRERRIRHQRIADVGAVVVTARVKDQVYTPESDEVAAGDEPRARGRAATRPRTARGRIERRESPVGHIERPVHLEVAGRGRRVTCAARSSPMARRAPRRGARSAPRTARGRRAPPSTGGAGAARRARRPDDDQRLTAGTGATSRRNCTANAAARDSPREGVRVERSRTNSSAARTATPHISADEGSDAAVCDQRKLLRE